MKKTVIFALIIFMCAALIMGCSAKTADEPQTEQSAVQDAKDDTAEQSAQASKEPAASGDENAEASEATDDSWTKIQENGKIIMGLDDSFPPMGFRDENGELVGFDIDLARAVADHLGVELELQPIDWSTKEMELEAGNIDMIWNGYTITDERKERVLMSDPYMENDQVIVVLADSDIKTLDDLEGKTVAVQEGSSAQSLLEEDKPELLATFGDFVGFKDYVTALMDVDSGQVDALAVDLVVADYYLSKKPGQYIILEETLAPEQYGIGFRKTDKAFYDEVQKAFNEMKEDGTSARISEEWFGRDVTLIG